VWSRLELASIVYIKTPGSREGHVAMAMPVALGRREVWSVEMWASPDLVAEKNNMGPNVRSRRKVFGPGGWRGESTGSRTPMTFVHSST